MEKLFTAFQAAFDSLVRTYSPMLVTLVVGLIAPLMGGVPVPEEVRTFVTLAVAVVFGAVWFLSLRLIEIIRGRASKLLGLGVAKGTPTYDLVPLQTLPDGAQMYATRREYQRYLRGLDDDADEQLRFAREADISK